LCSEQSHLKRQPVRQFALLEFTYYEVKSGANF